MTDKTPAKNQDQFIVRFPDGMRDRIKAAASASSRSMNSEIVTRLEKSFPEGPPTFEGELDIHQRVKVNLHVPYYLLRAIQAHEGMTVGTEEDVILRILFDAFPGSPTIEDMVKAETNLIERAEELFESKRLSADLQEKLNNICSAATEYTDLATLARRNLKEMGAPTPHQSEPVVDPTAGSGAFTLDAIAQLSEKQSKSKPKGRGLGAAPGEGRSLRPQGRSLRDALPKEEKSPPQKGRSIIDKPKPDSSTD